MILELLRDDFALALARTGDVVGDMPTGMNWLSATEQERLRGLRHPGRREEFLIGRWLVRRCYARSFGGLPAEWPLREQPSLPPTPERETTFPFLSISHGGGFVAAAIARQAIGVDVESATRHLPEEIFIPLFGHTATVPAQRLNHWVATEAYLKQKTLPAHTDTLKRHALKPVAEHGRVKLWRTDEYVFGLAAVPGVLEDAVFAEWTWWG